MVELTFSSWYNTGGNVFRTHAEAMGESVNAFLLRAVAKAIEHDSTKTADKEE